MEMIENKNAPSEFIKTHFSFTVRDFWGKIRFIETSSVKKEREEKNLSMSEKVGFLWFSKTERFVNAAF